MILNPNNPFDLIPATLATNPDLVVAIPIFQPARPDLSLVLAAKLRSRRIPDELAAQMVQAEMAQGARGNGGGIGTPELPTHMVVGRLLLTVPADIAENLRGPVEQRHPIYLMSVHRSAYDEAMRQATSGIVLPGSGLGGVSVVPGAPGRIVKP